MAETTVLHTTAEEIVILPLRESHRRSLLAKLRRQHLLEHHLAPLQDSKLRRLKIHSHTNLVRRDHIPLQSHPARITSGIVHQNLSLRLSLRIANHAPLRVLKNTESMRSVKIHIHTPTVLEPKLSSSVVEHLDALSQQASRRSQHSSD